MMKHSNESEPTRFFKEGPGVWSNVASSTFALMSAVGVMTLPAWLIMLAMDPATKGSYTISFVQALAIEVILMSAASAVDLVTSYTRK